MLNFSSRPFPNTVLKERLEYNGANIDNCQSFMMNDFNQICVSFELL